MKLSIQSRVSVLILSVALVSCGRSSELENDDMALFQQSANEQFGDSPLANTEVHAEMRAVLDELQNAILVALDPSYDQRALGQRAIFGCSPKIKFVAIGVGIEFMASDTCKLNGYVALKIFPLTTVIDLDVVGLKFIDRIQLDANIVLSSNADIAVDLIFLNGKLNIKLPILGDGIGFNGRAKLAVKSSGFQLNSRLNGYAGTSGMGVALIAKIDKAAAVRDIQSCLISAGDPNNPDAGNLNTCFKLGGG